MKKTKKFNYKPKTEKINTIPLPMHDLGGILSGTASGASMGSSLGPYGALVGALLGGVSSGVGGVMGENKELASYDKLVNNTQLAYGGNMTESINAGGTHEENPNEGVNIANKGLVEEGEVKFNYKDQTGDNSYIFSKRLGFANKAKSIMKKFEVRDGDKMANEAKEQRLKGLMATQEVVRSSMFDNQFKKAFGGKLKKYDGLNPWPSTLDKEKEEDVPLDLLSISGVDANGNAVSKNPYLAQNNTAYPTTVNTPAPYNKKINKLGQFGQFSGSLARLATAAQGPDAVNLQRISTNQLSSIPEEVTASNELNQVYNNLNKDIRNNAGSNAGSYLAARLASAGNQADKTGSTLSGIRNNFRQFNTSNKFGADQFNARTQHQEDDLRTRERDAVRTLGIDAAGLAGNTLGNITRDNTANDQQNDIINSMETANYSWGIDPTTGKLKIINKNSYSKGFGGFMYKSKKKK